MTDNLETLFVLFAHPVKDLRLDNFFLKSKLIIFSCPGQLNRWPCHSLSECVRDFWFQQLQSTSRHWLQWLQRQRFRDSETETETEWPGQHTQFLRCLFIMAKFLAFCTICQGLRSHHNFFLLFLKGTAMCYKMLHFLFLSWAFIEWRPW